MDTEETFETGNSKRKLDEITDLNEAEAESSKTPAVAPGTAWHYDPSESANLRALSKLPLSRIKRILKEDSEFHSGNADSYTLISKATELFIRLFAADSYNMAARDSRTSVHYKDCASLVSQVDKYEFLTDVIPTPLSLRKALEVQELSAPPKKDSSK